MNTFEMLNIIETMTPSVYAAIKGNGIEGFFLGYPYCQGSIVVVEVSGLPTNDCQICAMHIHEGNSCTGDSKDPFLNTKGHLQSNQNIHPCHTGDLPPLFSNHGFSWLCFYTTRFKPIDIIDRTIVIHENLDDFTSQPSGHSGSKIACGKIIQLVN